MRPAANPIQRAVQEIDLDIRRKEKELGKMRAARTALGGILDELKPNGSPRRRRTARKA